MMDTPEIVKAEVINPRLVRLTVSHHASRRTDIAVSHVYVMYQDGRFHALDGRLISLIRDAEVYTPAHEK